MAKTMRNVWDEKKKVTKKQGGSAVFLKSRRVIERQAKEGFAKTQKYFLKHLELKKVVMDFFPDYQRYLGEGGLLKFN